MGLRCMGDEKVAIKRNAIMRAEDEEKAKGHASQHIDSLRCLFRCCLFCCSLGFGWGVSFWDLWMCLFLGCYFGF